MGRPALHRLRWRIQDVRRRAASGLTFGLLVGLVAVLALTSVAQTGLGVESLFRRLALGLGGVAAPAGASGQPGPFYISQTGMGDCSLAAPCQLPALAAAMGAATGSLRQVFVTGPLTLAAGLSLELAGPVAVRGQGGSQSIAAEDLDWQLESGSSMADLQFTSSAGGSLAISGAPASLTDLRFTGYGDVSLSLTGGSSSLSRLQVTGTGGVQTQLFLDLADHRTQIAQLTAEGTLASLRCVGGTCGARLESSLLQAAGGAPSGLILSLEGATRSDVLVAGSTLRGQGGAGEFVLEAGTLSSGTLCVALEGNSVDSGDLLAAFATDPGGVQIEAASAADLRSRNPSADLSLDATVSLVPAGTCNHP